jgi:hypothetical protein
VSLPVTVSCNSESGHHYSIDPEQQCSGFFSFLHLEIENPHALAGNRKLRLRVWAPLFYKPCKKLRGFFGFCPCENPRVLAGNRKLRLLVWAPLFLEAL